MFSSTILKTSSEESLWEEETWDPENVRSSLIDPIDKEIYSCVAILNPGGKWFQREETFTGPLLWYLVIKNSSRHFLKFFTHNNFSNKRLLYLHKTDFHLL